MKKRLTEKERRERSEIVWEKHLAGKLITLNEFIRRRRLRDEACGRYEAGMSITFEAFIARHEDDPVRQSFDQGPPPDAPPMTEKQKAKRDRGLAELKAGRPLRNERGR